MKTLGQIAYEGFIGREFGDMPSWESADKSWHADWETAAKAVAAAVRTECLAAIESRFLLGEAKYAVNMAHDEAVGQCAAAIRSLALEAK